MSDVEALAEHGRQLQIYLTSWAHQHEEIVARMKRSWVDTGCVGSARPAGVPQTAGAIQAHSDDNVIQFARDNHGPVANVPGTSSPHPGEASNVAIGQQVADQGKSQGRGSVWSDNSVSASDGIRLGLSFMKDSFNSVALPSAAPSGRLRRIVESPQADAICAAVIIANAVFMAFVSDYAIQAVITETGDHDTIIQIIESVFTFWYVVELAVRIIALGRDFFCGPDWKWDFFDAAVVLAGVCGQFVHLVGSYFGNFFNASYLRLLRIAKMIKMLRVVRLFRAFKELRMVLGLVLGSCSSMFWASALLAVLLFLFSICFLQGVTQHFEDQELSNETRELMLLYWGSVGTSMNSLLMATTGGDSWRLIAQPLWDIGVVYYVLFLFYLIFYFFVIMNTLTGLFVDATVQQSELDNATIIREERKKKREHVDRFVKLFYEINPNSTGEICHDDFKRSLNSSDMLAFTASCDLDIGDVEEFFHLISSEGKDKIDVETFVVGCMKVKGYAKSLDVVSLLHTTKKLRRDLVFLTQSLDKRFASLESCMVHVRQPAASLQLTQQGRVACIAQEGQTQAAEDARLKKL